MKKVILVIFTISLLNSVGAQSLDCNEIVTNYVVFATKYFDYYFKIKENPASINIKEYTKMDNELREKQDEVMKCIKADISYANKEFGNYKVVDVMENVLKVMSSLESIAYGTGNSKTAKRECKWCSKTFIGDGFRYYIKNKETQFERIEVTKSGKFCSGACAIKYYNNTGERVYW